MTDSKILHDGKSRNQWICQISIHSGHTEISVSQHSPPVNCSVFMSFGECLRVSKVAHPPASQTFLLSVILFLVKNIFFGILSAFSKSSNPYEAHKFWPTFLVCVFDVPLWCQATNELLCCNFRTKGTFVVLLLGHVFAHCYVSTDIGVCASGFLHQLHLITSVKEWFIQKRKFCCFITTFQTYM